MAELMAGNDSKTERMRQIRQDRHAAGFREVTVWVPGDLVQWLRGAAWGLIDSWNQEFPHKDTARRKAELEDRTKEAGGHDLPS